MLNVAFGEYRPGATEQSNLVAYLFPIADRCAEGLCVTGLAVAQGEELTSCAS